MLVHDAVVARNDAQIRRNLPAFSKDRAKALLSAAIRRSSCGIARLAKAGGCSKRAVERAAEETSLLSFEVLINMLDEEPALLDNVMRAKGWAIVPVSDDFTSDAFETLGAMCAASGTLGMALADRVFTHVEILEAADQISRALPGQLAILRKAAELRGVA